MPIVTARIQGFSSGVPGPGRRSSDGGKTRGEVVGWSAGSGRRNTSWLQSVDPWSLPVGGLALTLTMAGWPASSADFHSARRSFLKRAGRLGYQAYHWVIEATAAGRPHLHLALYPDGPTRSSDAGSLAVSWLTLCDNKDWPALARAQTVAPITSAAGWMQYVSKHAARGVRNYQRSIVPVGWEKTGRLWGYGGSWPTLPAELYDLELGEFHRFRRLSVSLARSRMRAVGMSSTRVQRVGSLMRSPDRGKSSTIGVGQWLPIHATDRLVQHAVGAHTPAVYHTRNGLQLDQSEGIKCLLQLK